MKRAGRASFYRAPMFLVDGRFLTLLENVRGEFGLCHFRRRQMLTTLSFIELLTDRFELLSRDTSFCARRGHLLCAPPFGFFLLRVRPHGVDPWTPDGLQLGPRFAAAARSSSRSRQLGPLMLST